MQVSEVKPVSPTGRITQERPAFQQLPIGTPEAVAFRRSQGKSWLTQGLYDALLLEQRQVYLAGQRQIAQAVASYFSTLIKR